MSRPTRRTTLLAPLVLLVGACGGEATAAPEELEDPVGILAPADPGGGWDLTARAMQQALDAGGVADGGADVYNLGGAGGTVGLAQFVEHRGHPRELMVTGLVMVGAIHVHDSAVDLTSVTPVASLTTEHLGVAVPADSPYRTVGDLVAALQQDPGAIAWAGGSAGGADHILAAQIAQAAGVDPTAVDYRPHAGGGDALAALLSGGVGVGVSGLSELADQVEAGQLRLLAVSSEERLDGVDAPTLTEAGLDVVLSNWRGVVAPPELSEEERAEVVALVEAMHATPQWQDALEENGWDDFFTTGAEFEAFLADEVETTGETLRAVGLVD